MNRPFVRGPLAAALSALFLSACTGQSSTQPGTTSVYPSGLDTKTPAKDLIGISPASSQAACCWMAKHNRLKLAIPPTARAITLSIEVPAGIYKRSEQGVSVQFAGQPAQHHALIAGRQDVALPIPTSAQGQKASLLITVDASFVPAKIGMNNDTTEYTVFLRAVSFS